MKITDMRDNADSTFVLIPVGECFEYEHDTYMRVYPATDEACSLLFNAINMSDMSMAHFDAKTSVKSLRTQLMVLDWDDGAQDED